MKNYKKGALLLFVLSILLSGCSGISGEQVTAEQVVKEIDSSGGMEEGVTTSQVIQDQGIPAFDGQPYVVLNGNNPYFEGEDLVTTSYEFYSELDELGRCQYAMASIGVDIMPTEKRGAIGQVKPTGWHTVKYDGVDGNYLYNRCHLIGYQLTGENANERNLITGTRYLNVDGMLPFENLVADYVKETNHHVVYRVTPIYEENNLVASGVIMEAKSVEDQGEGILFNVYVYNNQPGIEIDYFTGESWQGETDEARQETVVQEETKKENGESVILNTNTKKIHKVSCSSVADMKEHNKQVYEGDLEELFLKGYETCKRCY